MERMDEQTERALQELFSDKYAERLRKQRMEDEKQRQYRTWDALYRVEHQIANLEGVKGVDVQYVTEEDDALPWENVSIVIYVKRKCSQEEFNKWFNREQ